MDVTNVLMTALRSWLDMTISMQCHVWKNIDRLAFFEAAILLEIKSKSQGSPIKSKINGTDNTLQVFGDAARGRVTAPCSPSAAGPAKTDLTLELARASAMLTDDRRASLPPQLRSRLDSSTEISTCLRHLTGDAAPSPTTKSHGTETGHELPLPEYQSHSEESSLPTSVHGWTSPTRAQDSRSLVVPANEATMPLPSQSILAAGTSNLEPGATISSKKRARPISIDTVGETSSPPSLMVAALL